MLAPIYGGGGGEPEGDLKADIDKTFGGLEGLKKAMVEESCRVCTSEVQLGGFMVSMS